MFTNAFPFLYYSRYDVDWWMPLFTLVTKIKRVTQVVNAHTDKCSS